MTSLIPISAPITPAQQPKLPDNVELVKDVEYGKGGERALKMHIIRPKVAPKETMPVLVWVHGGGWEAGNKNDGIGRLAPYAARGYFCATIESTLGVCIIFRG
jgi:carboxylesterase type B